MLSRGQRITKKRRKPSGFLALLALAALSSGCASNQYMGISLRPGAADPALQALAAKAQSGDKQSQYELGRWFEHSADPDGLRKAIKLYRIAATPRGGVRLIYTPGQSGVTTGVVNTGPKIEGLREAKERLAAIDAENRPKPILVGSKKSIRAAAATEVRLTESWDEIYLRESLEKAVTSGHMPKLSYDGKFLSLLYIREPISSERFNSPIVSGDTRSSFGLCRVFNDMLSYAWPGEMQQCQSYQWNTISANLLTLSQDFYTINYGHSGVHPECLHIGECADPVFSTASFNYPACGWFVIYRFKRQDGSKVSLFASLDADFYLPFVSKSGVRSAVYIDQRSKFCRNLDKEYAREVK